MRDKPRIKWSTQVEAHDFAAGQSYLQLLYPAEVARGFVASLKRVKATNFSAKDIVRASELELLSRKNADVAKQLKRIAKGEQLSPLLLVRESGHARLIIADGFHRLCAVHHLDPKEDVPCKIA